MTFRFNLGERCPGNPRILGLIHPWNSWLSLLCYDSQTNPPFTLTDIYQIRLAKVEITLRTHVGGQTWWWGQMSNHDLWWKVFDAHWNQTTIPRLRIAFTWQMIRRQYIPLARWDSNWAMHKSHWCITNRTVTMHYTNWPNPHTGIPLRRPTS